MLVLIGLEFNANILESQSPLLLQSIVLLQASTHMPLVVLVVLGDLRLALLEDLDLETTFSGPLLSQVLVKFLD